MKVIVRSTFMKVILQKGTIRVKKLLSHEG